jgi:hypothetical protein
MSITKIFVNYPGISYYILLLILFTLFVAWRKWYILDKRNLFRQKLFWLAVGVPLVSFFYFGAFAWYGKTPVLSAHGYARFYEISKFPLLLLASSVPLASIVNNIHRTIQTEAQIEAAEKKNAIDRHLAHEKNFVEKAKELLSFDIRNVLNANDDLIKYKFPEHIYAPDDLEVNIFKTHQLKVTNPYSLYSRIYSDSTIFPSSDYTANIDFLNKILSLFNSIDSRLNIKTSSKDLTNDNYIEILNSISFDVASILDILNVECTSNLRIQIVKEKITMITFCPHEMIFADIIEATYYITKKLISLAYGIELKTYQHINNYLYTDNLRFKFDEHIDAVTDFYSPEWTSYTSSCYCIEDDGDKLAAEH